MSFDLDIWRAGSSLPYIQVRVKVMGQSSRFGDEKVFLYGYECTLRDDVFCGVHVTTGHHFGCYISRESYSYIDNVW